MATKTAKRGKRGKRSVRVAMRAPVAIRLHRVDEMRSYLGSYIPTTELEYPIRQDERLASRPEELRVQWVA